MKYLSIALLLIFVQQSISQQSYDRCALDEIQELNFKEFPYLKEQAKQVELETQHWLESNPDANKTDMVYNIPVVVHVLWNSSAQNISTAQINSQIDVLNEDYSRTNADASQTPAHFQSIAGDAEIQFCLASLDPQGNPTAGITRTQTSRSCFNVVSTTDMYYTSRGGKDAWPSDKYLNIWVISICDTKLGGASLPGTAPPERDGFIVRYTAFGRTGNVNAPYDRGRTASHEIGHWLGLQHTFYQSGNCADDGVADTPLQERATIGCPSGKPSSCGNNATGNNFQNYLDYTDDRCMNMFTKGQAAKMRGTISTFRNGLLGSTGCGGTPVADAGILLINVPTGTIACGQPIVPKVRIKNFGVTNLTKADIIYKLDNGADVITQWTGNINPGGLKLADLKPFTVTTSGSHNFEVRTANPNGVTDTDNSNDLKSSSFDSDCGVGIAEYNHLKNISVYPNPGSGIIQLQNSGIALENISISVFDVSGRLVLTLNQQKLTSKFELDLSAMEPGTYHISLNTSSARAVKVIHLVE